MTGVLVACRRCPQLLPLGQTESLPDGGWLLACPACGTQRRLSAGLVPRIDEPLYLTVPRPRREPEEEPAAATEPAVEDEPATVAEPVDAVDAGPTDEEPADEEPADGEVAVFTPRRLGELLPDRDEPQPAEQRRRGLGSPSRWPIVRRPSGKQSPGDGAEWTDPRAAAIARDAAVRWGSQESSRSA